MRNCTEEIKGVSLIKTPKRAEFGDDTGRHDIRQWILFTLPAVRGWTQLEGYLAQTSAAHRLTSFLMSKTHKQAGIHHFIQRYPRATHMNYLLLRIAPTVEMFILCIRWGRGKLISTKPNLTCVFTMQSLLFKIKNLHFSDPLKMSARTPEIHIFMSHCCSLWNHCRPVLVLLTT